MKNYLYKTLSSLMSYNGINCVGHENSNQDTDRALLIAYFGHIGFSSSSIFKLISDPRVVEQELINHSETINALFDLVMKSELAYACGKKYDFPRGTV